MELPAHRGRKQQAAQAALLIAVVLTSATLTFMVQAPVPRYGLPVQRASLPAKSSLFRAAPAQIQRQTVAHGLSTDWVRMSDEDLSDRIRAMEHRKSKLDENQIQEAKKAIEQGVIPIGGAIPSEGSVSPQVGKHAKLLNDLAGAELEVARRLVVKQQSKALIREQKNRERRMRRMKENPSLLNPPPAATSVATVQAKSVGVVKPANMPVEEEEPNSQTGLWRSADRVLFTWNQTDTELRIRVNLYQNAFPLDEKDLQKCYDVYFGDRFFQIRHYSGLNFFRFDLGEDIDPDMCQWRYFKGNHETMDIVIDKGYNGVMWRRPIVAWRELEGMMIPPLQCSRQKERALSIFTSRYTAAAHDYNMARVERLNAEDDDEYEYY